MPKTLKPSDGELDVLRVLWERGPASVREVQTMLCTQSGGEVGYTTVLKVMQRMYEKGMLLRDDLKRPQLYRPSASQSQTQHRLLGEFLARVFGGSRRQLVLQLLQSKKTSPKEMEELGRLLDRIEGRHEP